MRKMTILFTGLFVLLFLSLTQAVSDQKEEKAKTASSEQEAAVEQKAVAEEETSVEQESPLKGFNLEGLSKEQIEMLTQILNENKMKYCVMEPISAFLKEDPQNLIAKQATEASIRAMREGKSKRDVTYQLKLYLHQTKAHPGKDLNAFYDINIENSPFRGPEDAKVTIVEFSDFQCPYCAKLHATLDQFVERNANVVKHVFKNYPLKFHKFAKQAAKAALAAGEQGKFWEMRTKLFENFRSLNQENILKFAQELELDMEKFEQSLNDPTHDNSIRDDMIDAIVADVSGTPTIFINGKFYRGERSVQAFETYIKNIIGEQAESTAP